jgi:hypothetical protein
MLEERSPCGIEVETLIWTEHLAGELWGKLQTAMPELLQALEVSDQAKVRLLGKTSQDISLGAVTSTSF